MGLFGAIREGHAPIDFVKAWRRGLIASGIIVAICLASLLLQGFNLGIAFEGGTSWEVPAPDASVSQARDAMGSAGLGGAQIQIIGGDTIRAQADTDNVETIAAATSALAELANSTTEEVAVTTVGPSWGDEISGSARRALIWFFIVVAAYIAIRMEPKMAIAALVAVFHDIIVTVGIYSVFQIEVTPATVIAFLTILGYSMYDTIVIFDKVRENTATIGTTSKASYRATMDLSMNQTLARSMNTTITSVLPVLSLLIVGSLILGAVTLQEFALALLIGLITGTYSSIFIAAPLLVWLKEREPRYAELRTKADMIGNRGKTKGSAKTDAVGQPAGAAPASDASPSSAPGTVATKTPAKKSPGGAGTRPEGTAATGAAAPRPRKKKKKK